MDLNCFCEQIIITVVFFQLNTHQTYKEIQRRNHVHSKPKVHQVYGVIPYFVSHSIELRTFIVEQSNSVDLIRFDSMRERERERETDRQRERERDIERETERDRQTDRDRERQRERQRDRERGRERETLTKKYYSKL